MKRRQFIQSIVALAIVPVVPMVLPIPTLPSREYKFDEMSDLLTRCNSEDRRVSIPALKELAEALQTPLDLEVIQKICR